MNGMWLYLKENVKCGNKLSDVICLPQRCSKREDFSSEDNLLDKQTVHHPISTPIRELIFRQSYTQTWLYELESEDPSRKIVEMIFQKASRTEKRVKTVLKIKNSIQSLEHFEKYREKVKNYTRTKHPRSVVDGNELLRFHATTISCRGERVVSSRKRLVLSSDCKSRSCRVCSILRSNFGSEYGLDFRVRLSSRVEDFDDNVGPARGAERAVIVCRAICGSSSTSCVSRSEYNESQQQQCCNNNNHNNNNNNVIMCNPSAVLPCFVIIYN